jgi:hypothetical protein
MLDAMGGTPLSCGRSIPPHARQIHVLFVEAKRTANGNVRNVRGGTDDGVVYRS